MIPCDVPVRRTRARRQTLYRCSKSCSPAFLREIPLRRLRCEFCDAPLASRVAGERLKETATR